ncbi:MAG: pimeloyl-ACP methyl ester esterase BioH [Coxiellaceae bacterium]|nr:pimeloyl-ACP methyl ester esterase BioH [Coxiellaceae bacterium]
MLTPYIEQFGQGEPIVLLHGWAAHSGIWQPIATDLARDYQVTLVDLPGFGRSNLADQPFALNTVLAAIDRVVPANATWVGWSLGGLIGLQKAIIAPNSLKQLITVATSPSFMERDDWPGMSREWVATMTSALILDYPAKIKRFLALQFHGVAQKQQLRDCETILTTWPPQPKALQEASDVLLSADFRKQLATLACPTTMLFGRLDAMVPVTITKQLPDTIRAMTFHDAAHIPFLTHPDVFLSQLRALL